MASPHLLPLISFTLGPVTLSWSLRKGRAWRGRRTVASLPTAAWGWVGRGGHCQLVLSNPALVLGDPVTWQGGKGLRRQVGRGAALPLGVAAYPSASSAPF